MGSDITQLLDKLKKCNSNCNVVVINADSKIDRNMIPDEMYSIASIFEIKKSEEYDDAYFTEIAKNNNPQTIIERDLIMSPIQNVRNNEKRPLLGKKGFWMIGKTENTKCDARYYIAVYTSNENLKRNIIEIVHNMEDENVENRRIDSDIKRMHTIGDMMKQKSSHLSQMKRLAKENASQCAKKIASVFNVEIGNAIATSCYGVLALHGRNTVNIYEKCGPVSESIGGAVIPVDPLNGVLFCKNKLSANHTSGRKAEVIPCGVGYTSSDQEIANTWRKHRNYIDKRVYWDNKEEGTYPSFFKKEYNDKSSIATLLEAYNMKSYEFVEPVINVSR